MAPSTRRSKRTAVPDDEADEEPSGCRSPQDREATTANGSADQPQSRQASANGVASEDQNEPDAGATLTPQVPDLSALDEPQPIGKPEVPIVYQAATSYGPHDDLIRQTIAYLSETGEQVAEAEHQLEESETFRAIDKDIRELIDLQAECKARRSALEVIKQQIEADEKMLDPSTRYTALANDSIATYQTKTSRQRYAQNELYLSFREQTWTATKDSAMPHIHDLIDAEIGDEDDSGDEILIGGAVQNYRCPLTGSTLKYPVTSTTCKHSYSKEAIEEYLGSGNVRCPATSCGATLSRRGLKDDPQLAKRVAAFLRREEEREMLRRQTATAVLLD